MPVLSCCPLLAARRKVIDDATLVVPKPLVTIFQMPAKIDVIAEPPGGGGGDQQIAIAVLASQRLQLSDGRRAVGWMMAGISSVLGLREMNCRPIGKLEQLRIALA